MKYNIKLMVITTCLGLITLNSCDLNRVPETTLSDGVYWQSDNDFWAAIYYLYKATEVGSTRPEYMLIADVMSDNAVSEDFNTIGNGTYLPESDFGPWNKDYSIIRAANNIIEKARAANFESVTIPRFIATARFFRAYAYADLVRRYGDVPLVMKTLDINDDELYAPRTPVEVVIDSIYSDLDYAAEHLRLKEELWRVHWGEVTKSAALALKSRVALRRGTWNKFHDNANFEKHLTIARDAAKAVMDGGEYSLFEVGDVNENYKQLFKATGIGQGNNEAIWVRVYGVDDNNRVISSVYGPNVAQGAYSIARSLVDSYLFMDGLPQDMSPLYEGQQSSLSDFVNRDPRLNGLVVKKDEIYDLNEPYIPNLVAATGYTIQKYFDMDGNNRHVFIHLMLIRYGEVLLNYAEAVYELNDAISDADLDISINLLRDRVGMPHLTNAFVTANGLDMREEIRRERRVELAMEGFRYDDLLRWKTAETELPKPILGVRLFTNEYVGVDPSSLEFTTLNGVDSIIVVESASKRFFDPSKHYLWPLPLDQLGLNPNLEQNPGWN